MYKIINRSRGPLILQNGDRLEKFGFAVVETITTSLTQMEKRKLISIHPFYTHNSSLPELPKEGAWYINGSNSYKFTKGTWENREVKPTLLPVTVKDGIQIHTEDKIYERQGKNWVILGGNQGIYVSNVKGMRELAQERFSPIEYKKAAFRVNPVTEETLLMIDVTGIDLLKFAKDVFDITPVGGKVGMIGGKIQALTDKEAQKLIDEYIYDEKIALSVMKIHGRDCRMTVYRSDNSLLIESNWLGHSSEDLQELLNRHGINL